MNFGYSTSSMNSRNAPKVAVNENDVGQQLGELVGQLVVTFVAGLVADELDDQREHRHGQHEGGEQQVELGQHPDRHTAADDRKLSVLLLHVGPGRALASASRRLVVERPAPAASAPPLGVVTQERRLDTPVPTMKVHRAPC